MMAGEFACNQNAGSLLKLVGDWACGLCIENIDSIDFPGALSYG